MQKMANAKDGQCKKNIFENRQQNAYQLSNSNFTHPTIYNHIVSIIVSIYTWE